MVCVIISAMMISGGFLLGVLSSWLANKKLAKIAIVLMISGAILYSFS